MNSTAFAWWKRFIYTATAAAATSGSPHSTIHLGAPPPLPPPPPTTPLPPPPTTPDVRLGEITPPQRLRDEEISPIERTI